MQDSLPSGNGGSFKCPLCSSRCCWVSSCACEPRHKISHWALREAAKSPPNRPLMRFEGEKKQLISVPTPSLSRKMNEAGRNEYSLRMFTSDVTACCFPMSFAHLFVHFIMGLRTRIADIVFASFFRVVEAPICLSFAFLFLANFRVRSYDLTTRVR